MIDPRDVYNELKDCGVEFFTGVPDSLLQPFCACVEELSLPHQHVIAANEGGSVALASGYHFGTGKCGLVYLQNSGLGNAINPLLSLADPAVSSVPMVLMIGWRGEPRVKDEPQHVRQGEVTLELLETMGVPYFILPDEENEALECVRHAHTMAMEQSRPVAIVVKKGAFSKYVTGRKQPTIAVEMDREQALTAIIQASSEEDVFVCTTGKASRELFELRERLGDVVHAHDFLTVGSMGHSSQIALGIALAQPEQRVVCLDGDGAMLMHLGGLAIIAQSGAKNFIHVVLNNGAHESVGGQPTVAASLDLPSLGLSLGYASAVRCDTVEAVNRAWERAVSTPGPHFIEVRIALGSRADLGRPSVSPIENKRALMATLRKQGLRK